MNFNSNDKSNLYNYGINGNGKIKIIGMSGMGYEFEIQGTISDYNNILEVYNDTIIVNFCNNPAFLNFIDENKFISAPLVNSISDEVKKAILAKKENIIKNTERTLFIKKIIDTNGNTIFINKDFNTNILPTINFMKRERSLNEIYKINSNDKIDSVSRIIASNIGQPIIVDGKSYVVSGIDQFDKDGIPIAVDASFKTNEYKIPIKENSTILTLDADGYFRQKAQNTLSDKKLFEERKAIIEHQFENQKQ